jgi:hypothetical protein
MHKNMQAAACCTSVKQVDILLLLHPATNLQASLRFLSGHSGLLLSTTLLPACLLDCLPACLLDCLSD